MSNKFWTDADEDLARAGTVGDVDLEALATYAPTFIHRSNDPETVDAVEVGIDVLCITVKMVDIALC